MTSRTASSRDRIVNIVTVTLVTVLIWMWAAGETRRTEREFATLSFVPPTEGSLRITPSELPNVEFEIRGPQRAIAAAAERFRTLVEIPAGAFGVPADPGDHQVQLRGLGESLVSEWRIPVTVLSADPPSIMVEIEALSRREARVVAMLPDSVGTIGNTEVSPSSATIELPGDPSQLESLGELVLTAQVNRSDLEGRLPGALHRVQVPLQVPAELASRLEALGIDPNSIRPDPLDAQVTLTLDSNDVELKLPNPVPVQIAGPAAALDDWTVTIDPESTFLRDVVLRGSKDVIGQLAQREGGLGVIAFVHLTSDDLLTRVTEKPVTLWSLPEGVEVTSVENDATSSPRIQFLIEEGRKKN